MVVDVGLYDAAIAADAARRLDGLPVLFVGVRCEIETIMARRRAAGAETYAVAAVGEPAPEPVQRWQNQVHALWTYDVEVNSAAHTPRQCADAIRARLDEGRSPQAFAQLAGR